MREPENIEAVIGLMPDFLGYIFYPLSKRFVGEKPDEAIFNMVPDNIMKTGVFVDEPHASVMEKIARYKLQAVQLHGNEPADYCEAIYQLGIIVIKSFLVANKLPIEKLQYYEGQVHYLLFDTYSAQKGGSGKQFNWEVLSRYKLDTPVVLSGGIGPNSVKVVNQLNYPFVKVLDVNSRFETAPAMKDINALKTFIDAVRNK